MVERKPCKGLADVRSADDGRDVIVRKQTRKKFGQEIRRKRLAEFGFVVRAIAEVRRNRRG
jgi:hypothetical protein